MRLVTALLATVIIAVGCGSDADGSDGSDVQAPAAEAGAAAPTTDADDAPDTAPKEPEPEPAAPESAEPEPEPAAPESAESEPEPADTAESAVPQEPEPHASDAYFALDAVMDISIEIDGADWDALRHQTRTLGDVLAEIEQYGLSRPFADIYTWFSATVAVDGETHTEVGVRKKGFVGSQSDTKPSLKLRFDKYVDGQSLGGVMERMTLNNSVQDSSMVNTCLSYRVFAAAGNPAPRCNFATVSVNGTDLGLYVHVEEIKAPFLLRHFDRADGNLYEGTVSDFTPVFRGTFEKKNNEDAADWSDIDAVVAALEDLSDAGLEALGEIVDLDRFLSFWATEVVVGHWDGYAGDRNNYWFYREPGGRFVFIPWGVDDTFHLQDDPNPFDDISDPPPSVLALTAIPNRLYNHPDWRAAYVERLREILDAVWDADELLAVVDAMAAVVQEHAPSSERDAAAADTDRVRKFILKRKDEILADLNPEPPDWPQPSDSNIEPPDWPQPSDLNPEPIGSAGSGTLEIAFETAFGTNWSADPRSEGTVVRLSLNGSDEPTDGLAMLAGHSSEQELALLPQTDDRASLALVALGDDGSLSGMTLVVDMRRLAAGERLAIGEDPIAGGVWRVPPGASKPDSFSLFTEGTLELSAGGTTAGDPIVGAFSGVFGRAAAPQPDPEPARFALVINEVAARGDPLDWFELHNMSGAPISLDGLVFADDLADAGKRVAFPAGTTIEAGGYLQIELDSDGWPGFALGGDEELGIWLADGTSVAHLDWEEGDSPGGQSYARMPDATGGFQTTDSPTPGAANHS